MPVADFGQARSVQVGWSFDTTMTNTPSIYESTQPFIRSGTPSAAKQEQFQTVRAAAATDVSGHRHFGTQLASTSFIETSIQNLAKFEKECAKEGWDGDGAIALTNTTISDARKFVQELAGFFSGFVLPRDTEFDISPEPDGDINFSWYRGPERILDVSIGHDRNLYFAFRFDGIRRTGRSPIGLGVPEEFQGFIRRLLA